MHLPISFSHTSLRLFAAFAATAAVRSQDAPVSLSLRAALAHAGQHHPSLVAFAHQERAAEGAVEQAALRPNPILAIEAENVFGTGALRGVRGLETTVQASQTLERGGKRDKRVAVATREREIVAATYAVQRADVLAAAALAFVEAAGARERVALAAEALRLSREAADLVERRVRAGDMSATESARARAAVAVAAAEVARAQSAMISVHAKLSASWGGATPGAFVVAGAWRVPPALPAEDGWIVRLAAHPRLALHAAVANARRAALEWERAQAAPDITVDGGLRFLRDGSDAGLVGGISIPLPVHNRNQGNIRAARERLAGAEDAARALALELRAGFSASWQELRAAHAAVLALRNDALPAAEEAHTVMRRAYEQAQASWADVSETQRALTVLRREMLEAEIAFVLAHVRVEAFADPSFSSTAALFSSR